MLVTLLLGSSLVLQLAAAFLAFRLMRVTRRRAAWPLIAGALSLMATRQGITFYRLLSGGLSSPPDLRRRG